MTPSLAIMSALRPAKDNLRIHDAFQEAIPTQ